MYAYAQKPRMAHSPTLRTVLMVEDVLQNAEGPLKVSELKAALPRKIMHNTLLEILDYLQISGKILIGTKGILWVYTPREELEKLAEGGIEI